MMRKVRTLLSRLVFSSVPYVTLHISLFVIYQKHTRTLTIFLRR
jgi:hypothetical protein